MFGRKAAACIGMLCALAPFSTPDTGTAASNGTTAFTCAKVSPEKEEGTFKGMHCRSGDAGTGDYAHMAIPVDTKTTLSGTNSSTASETSAAAPTLLKSTIFGLPIEFVATGVSANGWLMNRLAKGGEHFAEGSVTITYTGVTVMYTGGEEGAGVGCKVKNGSFETNPIKFTTAGQKMTPKLSSEGGEPFANIQMEGCAYEPLNIAWPTKGSIAGSADGATLTFAHTDTTAANSFTFGGAKAGVEGSLTLSGRPSGGEEQPTPLSFTTVETP
ncbi:MAG TPA: hypothetical protein VFJ57_06525 [Solirubrobacterales bacterium]|nr:hypothetical protein [Solirubrobacterales bacterium]